jgi:RHS repeat-associated protein
MASNSHSDVIFAMNAGHDGTSWQFDRSFVKYNSDRQPEWLATNTAVTGYDTEWNVPVDDPNVSGDFDQISASSGLIYAYRWHSGSDTGVVDATETVAGEYKNALRSVGVINGSTGLLGSNPWGSITKISDHLWKVKTSGDVVQVLKGSEEEYETTSTTRITGYDYLWHSGSLQIDQMKVTLPSVSTGSNGPATSAIETAWYDTWGREIWNQDGDGFLHFSEYDANTGALVRSLDGVDTALGSNGSGSLPANRPVTAASGPHVRVDYDVDSFGRWTKKTEYTSSSSTRAAFRVYRDSYIDANGNQELDSGDDWSKSTRTYRGWTSSNSTTGPIEIIRNDLDAAYIESLTLSETPSVTANKPNGSETITSTKIESLTRAYRDTTGAVVTVDAYFNVGTGTYSIGTSFGTASNNSSTGNFHRTQLGYDALGRLIRMVNSSGTVTRYTYDGLDRVRSVHVGTDDVPTGGTWADWPTLTSGTNLRQTSSVVYSGSSDRVESVTDIVDGVSANDRQTRYAYDWRDRLVGVKVGASSSESASVQRPIYIYTRNNLDEVTTVDQYDGDNVSLSATSAPSSSLLRAKVTYAYDAQGRVFRTSQWKVNPSNGSVGSESVRADRWFDLRGNVIKEVSPGGLAFKARYDGAGRLFKGYYSDAGNGAGGLETSWADAATVTGDRVFEQIEWDLDGTGQKLKSVYKQAFHNDATTGELQDKDTSPKARVSFEVNYFDLAGRLEANVNVGTNGGSTYSRPTTAPTASTDTLLLSRSIYNDAGLLWKTIDPRAIETWYEYDDLARETRVTEAYVNGAMETSDGKEDDDRSTRYTYNGLNQVLTMRADLPNSKFQETAYDYGVVYGTGTWDSKITSNDLLSRIRYPQLTGTNEGVATPTSSTKTASDQSEWFEYNALSEMIDYRDRNDSVHNYSYDFVGRFVNDKVNTLGSGVKNSVRELEYEFDSAGNLFQATSYSSVQSGRAVINQVRRYYNGFGQLTTEYQEHDGAVEEAGSTLNEKVEYTYSEGAGGANHSRLTSMRYPGGRRIFYGYGAISGNVSTNSNDLVSRISFIADDTNANGTYNTGTDIHLEQYAHLGFSTHVERNRPQPGVNRVYTSGTGDGGDQYNGLDRFGRVTGLLWDKVNSTSDVDSFRYGYDRNSNRLYRTNQLNSSFDELYQADGTSAGYDSLNRLTTFQRGTLNTGTLTSSDTYKRDWALTALGNWSSVSTDSDGAGGQSPASESRTHDGQNRITAIAANVPTYDRNGNMTKQSSAPGAGQFKYDAWNRMVEYDENGIEMYGIAEYPYDALGRRTKETRPTEEEVYIGENQIQMTTGIRNLYYSDRWQVIEDVYDLTDLVITLPSTEESATVREQNTYVWSPGYVDEMVGRDQTIHEFVNNEAPLGSSYSRTYAQQDANFNVTSLTNDSGIVQRRFVNDPYGQWEQKSATWGVITSDANWLYFHQGGRWNAVTQSYHFRNRELSAQLGRWIQQDPLMYVDGASTYQALLGSPTGFVDPLGLFIVGASFDATAIPVLGAAGSIGVAVDSSGNVAIVATGQAGAGFNIGVGGSVNAGSGTLTTGVTPTATVAGSGRMFPGIVAGAGPYGGGSLSSSLATPLSPTSGSANIGVGVGTPGVSVHGGFTATIVTFNLVSVATAIANGLSYWTSSLFGSSTAVIATVFTDSDGRTWSI